MHFYEKSKAGKAAAKAEADEQTRLEAVRRAGKHFGEHLQMDARAFSAHRRTSTPKVWFGFRSRIHARKDRAFRPFHNARRDSGGELDRGKCEHWAVGCVCSGKQSLNAQDTCLI